MGGREDCRMMRDGEAGRQGDKEMGNRSAQVLRSVSSHTIILPRIILPFLIQPLLVSPLIVLPPSFCLRELQCFFLDTETCTAKLNSLSVKL